MDRQHFQGSYDHTVDAKNRMIVPVEYRPGLGEKFVICKLPERCLALYTSDAWNAILAQARGATDPAARRKQRLLYSSMQRVEPDKQGRITLNPEFMNYASISKDVFILGADNRVEIWDPESWNKYIEEDEFEDGSGISDGIEF